MKARKDEWLMCIAFCAFIGVMALLFVLLPKSANSETEKRPLEQFPISADMDSGAAMSMITSGEFGKAFETYMADHIPGRDFFVGLNSYFHLLTGRQVSKDIYVAAGDRLVEKPVAYNKEYVNLNIMGMDALADKIGRPVDLMIVPSAGWAVQDDVLGVADPYTDEDMIRQVYDQTGDNINVVDLTSVFSSVENLQDYYYKTDHHWTSLGAHTGYKTYMQYLNREYREQDQFTVKTENDFKGSTHSRAALWMVPGEPLQMWHGAENLSVYIYDTLEDYQKGNAQAHDGVFYEERLQESDKYQVFLDGNHSVVKIHNPDAAGKGSIMVLRDSYSHCLGPMLAESYETVVLVDMRSYSDSVAELYEQEQFDDVLVCYSIGNFMTDKNLAKICFQ